MTKRTTPTVRLTMNLSSRYASTTSRSRATAKMATAASWFKQKASSRSATLNRAATLSPTVHSSWNAARQCVRAPRPLSVIVAIRARVGAASEPLMEVATTAKACVSREWDKVTLAGDVAYRASCIHVLLKSVAKRPRLEKELLRPSHHRRSKELACLGSLGQGLQIAFYLDAVAIVDLHSNEQPE